MKMKRIWTVTILTGLVLSASLIASAQTSLPDPQNQGSGKLLGILPAKTFSLLDPSRLQIRNSYSFSYVAAGKYSGSFGLYQTSIGYKVSNPLYVQVDLGYLHQPLTFKNNLDLNNRFFPNYHLYFNPSQNFHFSIDVLSGPSNFNSSNRYWYQEER